MDVTWTTTEGKCYRSPVGLVSYPHHAAEVDYGLKDSRGRAIGGRLVVDERPAQEEVRGHYSVVAAVPARIVSHLQNLRNGRAYGAYSATMEHASVEEAKASLLKRLARSRAAMARKFGR